MRTQLGIVLALMVTLPGTTVVLAQCDDESDQTGSLARTVGLAADFGDGVTPVESGTPMTGLDAAEGATRHYGIEVPPNADSLTITLAGGRGDADLYLRQGEKPTTGDYLRRSWEWGNAESMTIRNPEAGKYYIGIHAYEPFDGVTLAANVVGGDTPPPPEEKKPCLDEPGDLPDKVAEMWGEEDRREHHQLWHFVSGGGWDRLSRTEQRRLRARGWEPPDHDQEQLGLDFLCMHRNMVDYTRQAFERLGVSCKLEGWKLDEFPWGLDNNANDRNWPVPQWPGRNPEVKSDRSARNMRQQVTSTFANDDWLRTVSLGQMARGVERSFHNWMHIRFAAPQPNGDVCDTNWLGSTCSSQQNPYFWKLHPMIDQMSERWARANAGRTVELHRGGPRVAIPENFAKGHADEASDDDVYQFTTRLLMQQHDCWTGPMPGPPTIQGAPLVSLRGLLAAPADAAHAAMEPEAMAANRANTRAAVQELNESTDALRDFTINSIQDSILPVYTMMSAMLTPEERKSIGEHLDMLSKPFESGVRRGPALLTEPERLMLDVMLKSPEDFQRPSPSMVTVVKRGVRKVHDLGAPGEPALGAPLPAGLQPEQQKAAAAIIALLKKNGGVMRIPKVREALGLPPLEG